MTDLIYPDESYAIMGACFNVYKEKGAGFLEPVYQECLSIEFDYQSIPFVEQRELPLEYRGKRLSNKYKPDFICFDKIIIEIKAVSCIADEHRAQVINYLNASGLKLGILINFGHSPKVEYERFALTNNHKETFA